jgi:D-alanyl-D-alanine-carboxypeptidase/D-alanyl-D-alanine-endopeptidase
LANERHRLLLKSYFEALSLPQTLTMCKNFIFFFCYLSLVSGRTFSQTIHKVDGSSITSSNLTSAINHLVSQAHVTGMVVAVFNNNAPVYTKAFGYKNADTKEPLEVNSEFYGASLSKAVFSVLIMKLVEEDVLDLDKPLQEYLPKPIYEYPSSSPHAWHEDYSSLKNDSLYQKITARMCLDHTTGFPDWRFFAPDQKLRVNTEPGTRYQYSGEGIVYLQVVLERLLHTSLDSMMRQKIFTPLGMTTSSYTWQPRFESNYCFGHDAQQKVLPRDKDNAARAASTLETTPEDYIRFLTGVMNDKIISKKSKAEMFSPQIRIRSQSQFGPLSLKDSSQNEAIQLSYGLGWGLYKTPYGWGAFKEGHSDGFQHYSVVFPEKKMAILIMCNSDNGESIFKDLLEIAIGDKYMPWKWENYIPYNETTR